MKALPWILLAVVAAGGAFFFVRQRSTSAGVGTSTATAPVVVRTAQAVVPSSALQQTNSSDIGIAALQAGAQIAGSLITALAGFADESQTDSARAEYSTLAQ